MNLGSVLITGANRGLGLEFVKQFIDVSSPPPHIFAVCRNPDKAEDLQAVAKSASNVHIIKLDMKDYSKFNDVFHQVEAKVEDNGLNLLINNAGIMFTDPLEQVSHERMMENFEINTVSPLLLTKEFLPLLRKAASKVGGNTLSCSRAAVINITSKMGSISDNRSGGCYPYRVSKTALNMVTKSLAVDLKPHNILVLALHPGWVFTKMGGRNALIDVQMSVSGMMNVMLGATGDHSGIILDYKGLTIPW